MKNNNVSDNWETTPNFTLTRVIHKIIPQIQFNYANARINIINNSYNQCYNCLID